MQMTRCVVLSVRWLLVQRANAFGVTRSLSVLGLPGYAQGVRGACCVALSAPQLDSRHHAWSSLFAR